MSADRVTDPPVVTRPPGRPHPRLRIFTLALVLFLSYVALRSWALRVEVVELEGQLSGEKIVQATLAEYRYAAENYQQALARYQEAVTVIDNLRHSPDPAAALQALGPALGGTPDVHVDSLRFDKGNVVLEVAAPSPDAAERFRQALAERLHQSVKDLGWLSCPQPQADATRVGIFEVKCEPAPMPSRGAQ